MPLLSVFFVTLTIWILKMHIIDYSGNLLLKYFLYLDNLHKRSYYIVVMYAKGIIKRSSKKIKIKIWLLMLIHPSILQAAFSFCISVVFSDSFAD